MTKQEPMGFLLLDAVQWFEEGLIERLAGAGIDLTRAEAQLLVALERGEGRTSELARRLGVSRQSAHAVVKALVEQGLVRQVLDERNHSAKLVRYTKRGAALATTVRKVLADMEWDLAIRIGPMRVANLRRALEGDWGAPATSR